jgi:pre-60S factor REI1
MATLYGFFVPDRECCVDLEGMVGYLHEKVKLGHYCLHCQRVFSTAAGTIQHMRDSGHTKLRYEEGVDLEEFDVFYDFEEANKEYLGGEVPDDMSDGEAPPALGEYEDNISRAGFRINEIGELVLPTGKIIGHRALKRYYDQHYADPDRSEAVVAARDNLAQKLGFESYGEEARVGIAVKAGLQMRGKSNPNKISGREGAGVLVKTKGGGFSKLSLYRYVRMAKIGKHQEDQARHYKMRKHNNTNRMDKKGNRLMNGVSVAHAKR